METPQISERTRPTIRTVDQGTVVPRSRAKPIYVSWTSGVRPEEGRAAIAGVEDVLRAAGVAWRVVSYGFSRWAAGDYGCADWYQKRSMIDPVRERHGYGPQTNAKQVALYMISEPWQQQAPHYDLMILDADASTGEDSNNFVFGCTYPGAVSVQSIARIRAEIADLVLRYQIIRRVAAHEIGHVFGAPSGPDHTVDNERSLGRHCVNTCCLRQGLSTQEWIRQFREEQAANVQFCTSCILELRNWCRGN